MKKLAIFVLGLLIIIFIGRQVLLPKIIERGFVKLAAANLGVDQTKNLSDGVHVYI